MNSFHRSILAITIIGFSACMSAQARPQPPTTYNTYDSVAPGSRPLAMGFAFCAVGEDPSTVYFNPAGLTTISHQFVSITSEATRQSELTTDELFAAEMLKGRDLIFIGLTSNSGAVSWRPLADATLRTASGADWTDTEIKVNAFTLSASHTHNPSFDSGLNISYLSGRIAQSGIQSGIPYVNLADGNGCSLDYGMMYRLGPEFKLGLMLQNIAGFMWWDDFETEQLPFTVRGGFAFQIAQFLTFSSDWEKRYYRGNDAAAQTITHFGIEQNLGTTLRLRAGAYGTDLKDREAIHTTAGIGYQRNGYSLSLAGEKYRVKLNDVYRYLFSLDLPI